MNKEFIPYELALKFKELGFDEALPFYYDLEDNNKLKSIPMVDEIESFHSNRNKLMIAAPLYQQAFRFFREKYKLIGLIEGGYDMGNIYTFVIWKGIFDYTHDDYYKTYEEAELACLDKIIELI